MCMTRNHVYPPGTQGSNPCLSANEIRRPVGRLIFVFRDSNLSECFGRNTGRGAVGDRRIPVSPPRRELRSPLKSHLHKQVGFFRIHFVVPPYPHKDLLCGGPSFVLFLARNAKHFAAREFFVEKLVPSRYSLEYQT